MTTFDKWVGSFSIFLFEQVFPLLVAVLAITCLCALFAALVSKGSVKSHLGFGLPFGLLGGTSGLIAGGSSEPIVGAMLTGLLAILSALLSYIFSRDTAGVWRQLIPTAISILCLTALFGLSIGKVYKTKFIDFDQKYAAWAVDHEKLEIPLAVLEARYDLCVRKLGKGASDCSQILLKAE